MSSLKYKRKKEMKLFLILIKQKRNFDNLNDLESAIKQGITYLNLKT